MLNPLLHWRCVLRLPTLRGPPASPAQKENQGTTGGNPYGDPLAARNRTRFPTAFSYLSRPQSNPSGNRGKPPKRLPQMARKRRQRRQQHGSAWHWKQTDCWYYTEPDTKMRVPLFDEAGERIRGQNNKENAQLALARIKLAEELAPVVGPAGNGWTVARVGETRRHPTREAAAPLH